MKIWMSNAARNKKGYSKRQMGLILGSIFLAVIIIFVCIVLADRYAWSMQRVSEVLVLGISVAIIFIAVRIGLAFGRDVMIFCQDDNYDMYVVNALAYTDYRRGGIGICFHGEANAEYFDGY